MEDHIEDGSCMKENNTTEIENSCMKENDVMQIETVLHQIATSLQHAVRGYLSLASCIHKLEPCELLQMIAQMPPPLIDVPMLIRKALTIDGEEKVTNHLLLGEYELTNTFWSKLQNKYGLTKGRVYTALKGKRRPGGLQHRQRKKHARKLDTTTSCTNSESD